MWFECHVSVIIMCLCKIGYSQDTSNYEHLFDCEEISTSPYTPTFDFEKTITPDLEYYFNETILSSSDEVSTTEASLADGEKKISETIREMLEQFKNPNSTGIPGVEIPDPYPVPDIKKSVTFFDWLYLEHINVHGLSKIKVLYINTDFEDMEVNAALRINELQTKGTYRYSSLLMPRQGPFTVNITGLKITPHARLGVEIDGKLKIQDINFDDITFDTISVNFENLGTLGNILQGFINTAGNFIFENIKPHILRDSYTKVRDEMDKKIEEVADNIKFPNSIAPLDMILIDARRKAKEMGYDPYKLGDCHYDNLALATLSATNIWLTGFASIYRIGDMNVTIENNTVTANLEIGTQKLEGSTVWDISVGFMSTMGTASFSVEYIKSRITLAQSLDTRQRPILRELHLDVGNIQVRCDGAGTVDYIIEFVVNILPNLLRYQIIGALEGPIKTKLQEELNAINVEEEVIRSLPKIDEIVKTGLKLSSLRGNIHIDNDDEFFNF